MIKAKKSLGQNFLKDKNIVNKIINITKIKGQNIIEVGPGQGALTEEIVKLKPKNLILIEKDIKLYFLLKKKYHNKNIKIINHDALKFNFNKYKNYKIISNLPYNISSKFLLKTIVLNKEIEEIVCMIQSELADKFFYNGNKINKYNFLSNFCSKYEIKFSVSPNVFYPKPKVNSKVVHFILNSKKINYDKLKYFVDNFFINRRKKIKSNKKFKKFISNKILNSRYEDLTYKEILDVYESFNLPFC